MLSDTRVLLSALILSGALLSAPRELKAETAPASEVPPLSVYGSLPAFDEVSMSPSGQRLALVTTLGDQRSLLVLGKNREPQLKVGVGDFKVRQVTWADEDHVMLWVSKTSALGLGFTTDKVELETVAVVNVDKRTLFSVFSKYRNIEGGVQRYFGVRQRDGHLYGYFSGITLQRSSVSGDLLLNGTQGDLYEVDLDSQEAHRIASAPTAAYRDWLVDGAGRIAAFVDFDSYHGNWRIVNAAGKTIGSGVQPFGNVNLVGFGRDTQTLLYTVRKESTGADCWYELPLAGGEPTEILADGGAESAIHDRGGTRLIGFVRGGRQHFFDSGYQHVKDLADRAFPNLGLAVTAWDDAFRHLLLRTDGSGDVGTWWSLNMETGDADRVVSAYEIPATDIGPVRTVNYTAADGLKMDGILTLPPGREAKNLPLVMLPHGGPAAHDLPQFDWLAQAFAVHGYAVFQPNFRGSTQRGAQFLRAGHGQWGRKMQTDISDGLAELVRQGIVDPKRACIVGASYGGYAALAGVTLQSGLYRCAVSYAGIANLGAYRDDKMDASNHNATLGRNLDEELGKRATLDEVSPIKFVSKVSVPVLLIHGKNDTVVPHAQSESMARALQSAGKDVQLVSLDGEDHWLSRSKTRAQMLEAAVTFVEKNNPPN